jgi:hypothetical protein
VPWKHPHLHKRTRPKPRDLTLAGVRAAVNYEPETGLFSRAGKHVRLRKHNQGYLIVSVLGCALLAHRLAWFWMTGEWPEQIDHRNGSRDDNRWENLRQSDHSTNGMNSRLRSHSTLGVKGVARQSESKTFCARITVKGKRRNLGSFRTIEEASAAYKRAAKELHGDFAYQQS